MVCGGRKLVQIHLRKRGGESVVRLVRKKAQGVERVFAHILLSENLAARGAVGVAPVLRNRLKHRFGVEYNACA